MARMRQSTVPWWRWRAQVRSALHMFGDPTFQRESWLAGRQEYGSITDAVYRLVGDSWLDRWSAGTYVGCVFVDDDEAAVVDAAVVEILAVLHEIGDDAPAPAYLTHTRWTQVVAMSRAAHFALAEADGDDPQAPPESLDALRIRTGRR